MRAWSSARVKFGFPDGGKKQRYSTLIELELLYADGAGMAFGIPVDASPGHPSSGPERGRWCTRAYVNQDHGAGQNSRCSSPSIAKTC